MSDLLTRLRNTDLMDDHARLEAADEIERLRALIKLATDAWQSGSEDECSVACMDIANAVNDEQIPREIVTSEEETK